MLHTRSPSHFGSAAPSEHRKHPAGSMMKASLLGPLTYAAIVPRCNLVAHSGHTHSTSAPCNTGHAGISVLPNTITPDMQSISVLTNTRHASRQGAATRVHLCAVRRELCVALADASRSRPGARTEGRARAQVGVLQRRPVDCESRYDTARPAAAGAGGPELRAGGARSSHAPTTRSAGSAVQADRREGDRARAPCHARQSSPPARGARRLAAARARRSGQAGALRPLPLRAPS